MSGFRDWNINNAVNVPDSAYHFYPDSNSNRMYKAHEDSLFFNPSANEDHRIPIQRQTHSLSPEPFASNAIDFQNAAYRLLNPQSNHVYQAWEDSLYFNSDAEDTDRKLIMREREFFPKPSVTLGGSIVRPATPPGALPSTSFQTPSKVTHSKESEVIPPPFSENRFAYLADLDPQFVPPPIIVSPPPPPAKAPVLYSPDALDGMFSPRPAKAVAVAAAVVTFEAKEEKRTAPVVITGPVETKESAEADWLKKSRAFDDYLNEFDDYLNKASQDPVQTAARKTFPLPRDAGFSTVNRNMAFLYPPTR